MDKSAGKKPLTIDAFLSRMIVFFVIAFVISVPSSCILFLGGREIKSEAAYEQYDISKDQEYKETYNKFYQNAFDSAEEKYHVKNEVSIVIDSLKSEEKLEVLRVSDVEFVVQDSESSDKDLTAWIEVPGTGVFTVNLAAGEFIVDDARKYVLVRVPKPVLSECTVDYEGVSVLLLENDSIFNGSIDAGADAARKEVNEGFNMIKAEMTGNRNFYETAENSAKILIENLVLALNPEVEGLEVEVEFYSLT